jgi:hypothetical protein
VTRVPFIESMRPEPDRDEYGRYILPDPTSGLCRSFTRATTIAHTLDDEFHLTQWKRRMVLQGVASDPSLIADVPNLIERMEEAGDNWRETKAIKAILDDRCDTAAEKAGANKGSQFGTLLHTITEYDDAGRYDEIEHLVPENLIPDLEAYRETMRKSGLYCPPEYIERIVVNSAVDGAGTFDRLIQMPDGQLVIGDLKTQKTVDFGFLSMCIQLAEYSNADAMLNNETGELEPMLEPMPENLNKNIGIIMHLPVGQATCTLYKLDLATGWVAAQLAHQARTLRSRSKALGQVYTPPRKDGATGEHLLYLIRSAGHPDALIALWRDAGDMWTDLHTQAARTRKTELANTQH